MDPGIGGGRLEDVGGEVDRRGPAAGEHVQLARELVDVGVDAGGEEGADLIRPEGEVGRPDIEDLPTAAKARDEERRVVAGAEHEVETRRRVAHEPFEHHPGAGVLPQLVDVVDDQHQVVERQVVERRCDPGGLRVGERRLVTQPSNRHGELADLRRQRARQPAGQRRRSAIGGIERVPGPAMLARLDRHLRGLPVPRAGDDRSQAVRRSLVEPALEPRPRDVPRRDSRRGELDGRGRHARVLIELQRER